MKNVHQKIQTLSNVAIIIVALLFGLVLVNRYLLPSAPKPSVAESNSIKAGMKLPLSAVDWSKSDKTLLIVLSTNCRYCTESTPFYQKLTQQKAGRNDVKLVAVMPQSVSEAQRYLGEHKVSVDEIKQANLDDVYVKGTPTLIVVDRDGSVVESWMGKLPPEKEAEVINHIFGERSGI